MSELNLKAYNGKGKYIFVSYAHKDKDIVYPIIDALQKKYNVWFDDGIHLGKDYKKEIIDHLKGCELFIFFVSKNSLESKYCKKEIYFADEIDKNFINVLLEDFEMPDWYRFDFDYIQSFMMYKYQNLDEAIVDLARNAKTWFEACKILEEEKAVSSTSENPNEISPLPLDILDEVVPFKEELTKSNEEYAKKVVDVLSNLLSPFIKSKEVEITDTIVGPSFLRVVIEYKIKKALEKIFPLIETDIHLYIRGEYRLVQRKDSNLIILEFELPNKEFLSFKEFMKGLPDAKRHPYAIALGMNASRRLIWNDYDEFPHVIVAGTTGSGKSVFVNSVISTLIMRLPPSYFRMILVDPKIVELVRYNNEPHLLVPVLRKTDDILNALNSIAKIVNERVSLISKEDYIDIRQYNEAMLNEGKDILPYILIVVEEFADIVDIDKSITRIIPLIANVGRSVGIHLLIATQRPSQFVLTEEIKKSIPTRIALRQSSMSDSIALVEAPGAEKLMGLGDMLVKNPFLSRQELLRAQGCFINSREIRAIIQANIDKYPLNYNNTLLEALSKKEVENTIEKMEETSDEKDYQVIKKWAMEEEYISSSKIQRTFGIGFVRSQRYTNRLIEEGVISRKAENAKGLKVIK